MAAVAFAPTLKLMPTFQPPRGDEFGEVGFSQHDRDELKKAGWLLQDIREKMDAFDRRMIKLEDSRAHQKELDELRVAWEKDRDYKDKEIDEMRLRLAAYGGVIAAVLALEPIIIHFLWK